MLNIEENLKYNITVPKLITVADYIHILKQKTHIYIRTNSYNWWEMLFTGKVNKDLEISSAVKAAELCMLNSFAILRNTQIII